jgi:nucleoside diphosphate kinase
MLRSYVTLTHKAPIVDQSTQKAPQETMKEHYKEHSHRKFYQELVDSMSSGPIVIIHLRGSKAVSRIRNMLGATDPSTADPGSLRGTYGIDKTNNFMVTDYLHFEYSDVSMVVDALHSSMF